MAVSKSVSWKTSKAGYDPGQSQSITVKYKSRAHKKVTCHVSFSATSLGQDDYTASQRHNHASVIVQYKNDDGKFKKLKEYSWNYQLHGGKGTSTSHSSDFSFESPYGITTLRIIYDNDRVGTNTPNYGPKSTGKVENEVLGWIAIDDCDNRTIKYRAGLNTDAIDDDDKTTLGAYNLPATQETYWGKNFKVDTKIPLDRYTNYTFTGWVAGDDWKVNSKTKKKRKVNTTTPKYRGGDKYSATDGNVNFYACWTPKIYNYRYYPTQTDAENRTNEWSELLQHRTYATPGIEVPDISNADVNSKYYKKGYTCVGWQHWINQKNWLEDPNPVPRIATHRFDGDNDCNVSMDAYSWPLYEANEGSLVFDYNYDDRTYNVDTYASGDTISFIKYCTAENGGYTVKPTDIRAGYRLLGWSLKKPSKDCYLIGETPAEEYFAYDSTWSTNVDTDEVKTFYAIWELESTLYVYTQLSLANGIQGKGWKLVVPYVYTDDLGWNQSAAMAYTKKGDDTTLRWKL